MQRIALFVFALLATGCAALPGLDAGLQTAGAIVDTAAVVRAKQLGLCGDTTPARVTSAEDALHRQEEIEQLKADLARAQGQLTTLAIELARRSVPPPAATSAPAAPSSPTP